MSRARRVLAFAVLSSLFLVGGLVRSDIAHATCPLSPSGTEVATSGCYYPEVSVSANPTQVVVNSGTSTISYTISGADPSVGCVKTGGWSGSIPVNSSGYAAGQGTVGPFGSTGTIGFNVSCPANPVAGYAGATVTVTDSGGGGGGGGGGGTTCSENNTSQLYSQFVGMTPVPSTLDQGQTFPVSITFKNTGTCTWTASNGYKLGSQNPENNTSWGTSRVLLASGDAIAPGQSKTFSFTAQGSSSGGSYGFQWRMVREGVNWFGPSTPNQTVAVDSSISQNAIVDSYGAGTADTDVLSEYRQSGNVSCRVIKPWVKWSQVITGLRFWTYRQDITWCWDNKRITSVSRNRYADVNNFPGNPWSFEGHQSTNCNTENCSDKASGTTQTITTQGHFKACALYVIFCNSKHPYIEVEINRGGGFKLVKATP